MHDFVRILAERGNIPHRDAMLVASWVSRTTIYNALNTASVWELRDRVLKEINTYTSKAS